MLLLYDSVCGSTKNWKKMKLLDENFDYENNFLFVIIHREEFEMIRCKALILRILFFYEIRRLENT